MTLDITYSAACQRWYTLAPCGSWRFVAAADVGTLFTAFVELAAQAQAELAECVLAILRPTAPARVRQLYHVATAPSDGRIRWGLTEPQRRERRRVQSWL